MSGRQGSECRGVSGLHPAVLSDFCIPHTEKGDTRSVHEKCCPNADGHTEALDTARVLLDSCRWHGFHTRPFDDDNTRGVHPLCMHALSTCVEQYLVVHQSSQCALSRLSSGHLTCVPLVFSNVTHASGFRYCRRFDTGYCCNVLVSRFPRKFIACPICASDRWMRQVTFQ